MLLLWLFRKIRRMVVVVVVVSSVTAILVLVVIAVVLSRSGSSSSSRLSISRILMYNKYNTSWIVWLRMITVASTTHRIVFGS